MTQISRRELIALMTVSAGLASWNAESASAGESLAEQSISLAGMWRFSMGGQASATPDSQPPAINFSDSIFLPGTTEIARKGHASDWPSTDSLSFPYGYEGVCWYQRDFAIPASWSGKRASLLFERTKYSQIWIDGRYIGDNAFWCTPQEYDLGTVLSPGSHTLTVMVDNSRLPVKGAADSHQWSGNTQGNWNGIIGRIELSARDNVWLDDIQAYPSPEARSVTVKIRLGQAAMSAGAARIWVEAQGEGIAAGTEKLIRFSWAATDDAVAQVVLNLGEHAALWDEFHPALHTLNVHLAGEKFYDRKSISFGLRSFVARDHQFSINGRTTFLRGKHDACVFPLTGHPPMDVQGWLTYFKILQQYGLNHVRFHTWTPPNAAFEAADQMGFYLQPELPFWGDFAPDVRASLEPEAKRILRCYGNHPSFVMFSMGNEPWGGRDVLSELLGDLHQLDDWRLFTHGTGDGVPVKGDDYTIAGQVRPDYNTSDRTVRGANTGTPNAESHVQFGPPNTMVDYSQSSVGMPGPVVTHEMGQYTVYPDFAQIAKYTGVTRARNLERFQEILDKSGMAGQAKSFAEASGALAAICYREEIETCLRTPKHAGFELLDLVDFPGQGTALVGMLDAFMESKGIIAPEKWREFCAPVTLLARFEKYVWTEGETFTADVEFANYSASDISGHALHAEILDSSGNRIAWQNLERGSYACGGLRAVGKISIPLQNLHAPEQVTLTLKMGETGIATSYPLWIYPSIGGSHAPSGLHVTQAREFDQQTRSALEAGKSVLLVCDGSKPLANMVGGGFATDFWNFRFFHNRPGTMGLLCDPKNPALSKFPTEMHSNWQWFDIAKNSQPLVLDGIFPAGYVPIVQTIDNYDRCHKLGLVFEARVGAGRLLVIASDLIALGADHPEASCLLKSLFDYAASDQFAPKTDISADEVAELLRTTIDLAGSTATASSTDSGWQGFSASQLIDSNESKGWRADPKATGETWCQIEFAHPTDIGGLEIVWDEDKPGYKYMVMGSHDGATFTILSDQTANSFDKARHEIACSATDLKLVKIEIEAVPYTSAPMIMEVRFFPQPS